MPALRTPILRRTKIVAAVDAQSEFLALAAAVEGRVRDCEDEGEQDRWNPKRYEQIILSYRGHPFGFKASQSS